MFPIASHSHLDPMFNCKARLDKVRLDKVRLDKIRLG
jgi:hypothetical protein